MYDLTNLIFEPIYEDHLIAYIDETTQEKGARIILAKDATADVNILDKTVGPANWKDDLSWDFSRVQNSSGLESGMPFMMAKIAIKDPETGEWVEKVGVGEASALSGFSDKALETDAIKRAGFKWGIGRELKRTPRAYIPFSELGFDEDTAPSPIYTNSKMTTIKKNEYGYDLYKANDILEVLGVDYTGEGYDKTVCWIRIRNKLTDKIYSFGKPVNRTISEKEAEPQPAPQQPVKKKEFKAKKSTTNNVPASIDTSVIIDFGCFEKNPTPLNQLPAQQIVWVRTNPFASTDIKQACDALAKNSEELQKLYKLKKITI